MTGRCIGQLGTCDSVGLLINEILRPAKKVESALALLGLVVGGRLIWFASKHVWRGFELFIYRQWFGKIEKFDRKYGKWAVITGASEGLGSEFARQLASRGMNIFLIGSHDAFLNSLCQYLVRNYGVKVCICVTNFKKDSIIYGVLAPDILAKEIGVLVNNVGAELPEHSQRLGDLPPTEIWNKLQIGVIISMMCRMVVPQMIQRRRGAVINISPSISLDSHPLPCYYLAQKKYVEEFGEVLKRDHADDGISVMTLKPYAINYDLTREDRYLNPSIFAPTPFRYVRSSLFVLGHTSLTTGYWAHGLQYIATCFMPSCVWKASMDVVKFCKRPGRPKKFFTTFPNTAAC